MKKEIGSIFPLSRLNEDCSDEHASISNNGRVLYSLCREVLKDIAIANSASNKMVLLPAYTCQTVITPFKEAGWHTIFYPLGLDLRIKTSELIKIYNQTKASLIVVHPYYGMDLDINEESTLIQLKSHGIKIVIDLTQCVFSDTPYSYCDYRIGSYRKWFPIPDGAFLECHEKIVPSESRNNEFVNLYSWAMYLRHKYFSTGDKNLKAISIALSKNADNIVEKDIVSHNMSELSISILSKSNLEENQSHRFENYSFLWHNILNRDGILKACKYYEQLTSAPLYFPLYVDDRTALQKELADNSVYAPVLWPIEEPSVIINDDIRYIYDHLLVIPCDQRYDVTDMKRITQLINSF